MVGPDPLGARTYASTFSLRDEPENTEFSVVAEKLTTAATEATNDAITESVVAPIDAETYPSTLAAPTNKASSVVTENTA